MIESKYIVIVDRQDDRDGGRAILILSVIDESIGLKARHTIAVFEAAHANLATRVADMLNEVKQEPRP